MSRPSDALEARAAAKGQFTTLLLGLGAVALLVGAIGIANIMVISVLERRGEIGLRRALGATRRHITIQFLAESALLAALGGIAGLLLGALATLVYALARRTSRWVVPAVRADRGAGGRVRDRGARGPVPRVQGGAAQPDRGAARDVVGPRRSLRRRDRRRGPIGPPERGNVPRFAGPETFARLPRLDDVGRAAVAILGAPFDSGTSYRPGAGSDPARCGPPRSCCGPTTRRWMSTLGGTRQVADAGDAAINPFDLEAAVGDVERAAGHVLGRAERVVTIGGDHTIALPLLRAVHARHGPPALVHFDAHLDTWDTYFGASYTHGTPFRRAAEEGVLDTEHSIHVGIRGPLYASSDLDDDAALGYAVISTARIAGEGVPRGDRADPRPRRQPPAVRERRHRRARPRPRAGHGHARARAD